VDRWKTAYGPGRCGDRGHHTQRNRGRAEAWTTKPINDSRHILISLGARSVPKSDRELPFYSAPVEGQLSVKAPKGLKLYKRANAGRRNAPDCGALYRWDDTGIGLDKSLATYWLFLR